MNGAPVSRDLALAFGRPFRKDGLKALLFSLLFLLLPFTAFISRGAAWSLAAGRREGVGGWAKLGLKILVAQLLLAAPAFFFYAVYKTFDAKYVTMPLWFHLLMTVALLASAVRTAVLSPVSAGCLALGAPLRTAICAKELKSIVSLSMGRYLLSSVISLAMLFLIGAVCRWLHVIPAYLVGAVLMALWNFFSAGLYMGCCRFALGIDPPEERGGGFPPPRFGRAVAGVLIVALLLTALPVPSFAMPGGYDGDQNIPVNPAEGAIGNGPALENKPTNYLEAYRYFSARGQIGPGEEIGYDGSNGTYYVMSAEAAKAQRAPGEAIIHTADVVSDFIPGLGNIKSGLQANYYYHQALKTDDPELKKQYSALAAYKAAGIVLGGVAKCFKAGSAGAKALGYVDITSKVYDGVSNFLTYIDILWNKDLSSKIGPHKIAEFFDDLADIVFVSRPEPQNVLIDFDPAGMPSGYTVPVSDGTVGLTPALTPMPTIDLDATPEPTVIPQIGPIGGPVATPKPTEAPIPIPTLALPDPVGRYSGTLIVPDKVESMGAVIKPGANPVYVTLHDDGTATFQTEMSSSYSYSGFGAKMNGNSTATIRQENIAGKSTAGGITYSFTQRVTNHTTVSYAGEMYYGGGASTEVTGQVDYTVNFTVYFTNNGGVEITGSISGKPVAQGGEQAGVISVDMAVKFTCTKMG